MLTGSVSAWAGRWYQSEGEVLLPAVLLDCRLRLWVTGGGSAGEQLSEAEWELLRAEGRGSALALSPAAVGSRARLR